MKFVEKSSNSYSILLNDSFVQASNGHMTESYTTLVLDVNLTEKGMETQFGVTTQGGMSDAGGFGDSLSTINSSGDLYTGVLQKTQ